MPRTVDPTLEGLAVATDAKLTYLFRFEIAKITTGVWTYTNIGEDTVFQTETYTPQAIELSTREGGKGTVDFTQFEINIERLEPFNSFVGGIMPYVLEVKVYEVFYDAVDTLFADPVAEGQLIELKATATGYTASFRRLTQWVDKKFPSVLYSRLDQRVPYGTDFGITPATFKDSATVDAVDLNEITSTQASAKADGYYANGYIEYTKTVATKSVIFRRPVMNNTGGKFILQRPAPLLVATDVIDVYAGYNGALDIAKTLFNNVNAGGGFQGFPYMPASNPSLQSQAGCEEVERNCAIFAAGFWVPHGTVSMNTTNIPAIPTSGATTWEYWFKKSWPSTIHMVPFGSLVVQAGFQFDHFNFTGNPVNEEFIFIMTFTDNNNFQVRPVLDPFPSDDEWHHAAAVWDGAGDLKVFFDGLQIAQRTKTGSFIQQAATHPIYLGASPNSLSSQSVIIDEVRISTVARYSGTFTPVPFLGLDANVFAYWRMNEGQGAVAADIGSGGNNMDNTDPSSTIAWVPGIE